MEEMVQRGIFEPRRETGEKIFSYVWLSIFVEQPSFEIG